MALKKCPKCKSEQLTIVTQAIHVSSDEGIESKKDHYVAWNSDTSWQPTAGTEKFVCEDCDHEWRVDKKVIWEWYG